MIRVFLPDGISRCGNWKTQFESIGEVSTSKIDDEAVYVIEKKRKSGVVITEYYSEKTYLLRKRQSKTPYRPDSPPIIITEVYDDYKKAEKLIMPRRVEVDQGGDKFVFTALKFELNGEIPEKIFERPKWAGY